jgi:hypothetical protein
VPRSGGVDVALGESQVLKPGSGLRTAVSSKLLGGEAAAYACCAAALVLIITLGLVKLPMPLHRDTATFLWIASLMDQGAVLYVDVWDVKQPGIFLFYWLAGKVFGFTSEGVHLFELVWQLTFAVVVTLALRARLAHPWLAPLAPVAILASYWAFCEPHQQTQLEILVSLPLFVCAWITTSGWRKPGRCFLGCFAAGVAAGFATLFKHLLAPIALAFLVAATLGAGQRGTTSAKLESPRARILLHMWVPFAAGVMLVWGATAATFWRLGAFDAFIATNILYPLGALGDIPVAPLHRLAISVAVCAASLAPWLPFAALALARVVRSEEPALFHRMALWLLLAIPVCLVQKNTWWTYHTLLYYAPVGVLAVRGIDLVVARLHAGQAAARALPATALAALIVLPILAGFAFPMGQVARGPVTAMLTGEMEAWRRAVSRDYEQAADAAAFLRDHAPPGSVYVFGDPTITLLTPRAQAIAPQGSAWPFNLPPQWAALADDLQAARPVWVFVETHQREAIAYNSPETMAWLARDYRVVWDTPYGRWYARTDGEGRSGNGRDAM